MTALDVSLCEHMFTDFELAMLSDNLGKLNSSPENFSPFYRKLAQLRFPLPVADVLELRYLFNHAIDQMPEPERTRDFHHFREARQAEMEAVGIDTGRHGQRLLKLLAVLRQLHLVHIIESRDAEAQLRRALEGNEKAARASVRYGKVSLVAALVAGTFWWLADVHWWTTALAVGLGYLSADYFYSLSILKRERSLLQERLDEVLAKRVSGLHWPLLIRNIALILGYARIDGVEAFEMHGEADDARAHL